MAQRINWKRLVNNIPSHVSTKDGLYEVLYTEEFKDGKTLGESRFEEKQIVLKKGLSPKETVHTYFHELLHVSSEITGANLTENQVLSLEKDLTFWLNLGIMVSNRKTRKKKCK